MQIVGFLMRRLRIIYRFNSFMFSIPVKLGELESAAVTFEKSLNLAKSQGKACQTFMVIISFVFLLLCGMDFIWFHKNV